jgi:hypothetical protein
MTEAEPTQTERGYWRKPENYVAVITLVAVLTYTAVQIWQTSLIRQNSVVSQRAFVSEQIVAYQRGFNPEKLPAFGVFVKLENNGATPTLNLISKIICEPSVTKAIEPWDYIKQHNIETGPISIGAKSFAIVQCSFTLEQIKQMASGSLYGYVLGEVTYYDRIDPSVQHKTHYAFDLHLPIISPDENFISAFGISAGRHNCADEECPK